MFRVRWLQGALDELAETWMSADSGLRQEITSASHELDLRLSKDPIIESESRPDGERILFAYPLGALIEVDLEQGSYGSYTSGDFGNVVRNLPPKETPP